MEAINYAANYAGRIFNIETLGKAIAYFFGDESNFLSVKYFPASP